MPQVPLFKGLDDEAVSALCISLKPHHANKGDMIAIAGEECGCVLEPGWPHCVPQRFQ